MFVSSDQKMGMMTVKGDSKCSEEFQALTELVYFFAQLFDKNFVSFCAIHQKSHGFINSHALFIKPRMALSTSMRS